MCQLSSIFIRRCHFNFILHKRVFWIRTEYTLSSFTHKMFIPLLCLHDSCWIVYCPSMSSMATLWNLAERSSLKMHKIFWNVCSSDFLNICTKMDIIYKLWSTVTWQETGQNSLLVTCVNSSFGVSRALFVHVSTQVDTHNF